MKNNNNKKNAILQKKLLGYLKRIHDSNPNHEMFGPIQAGCLCAPYESNRSNGTSWKNIVAGIVAKVKSDLPDNSCWMSSSDSIKITKQEGNKTLLMRSVKIVRFLAFLKDPTDNNWNSLRDKKLDTPFDHHCQRGEKTDPEQGNKICINGIDHGCFSTHKINESRKNCKNGAALFCPHEPKCIFTHPDGRPKNCRNQLDHISICQCIPRCY